MWQLAILALFQTAAGPPAPATTDAPAAPQTAEAPIIVDENSPIVVPGEMMHPREGRITCRREVVTGSTIPRRVCRTQALIDAEAESVRRGRMRPNMPRMGRSGWEPN